MEILFGLIAALGFGLSNAISQVPSKKLGAKKTVFYRAIYLSLILFFVLVSFIDSVVLSWKYVLFTLGISFIGYFSLISFFKALKVGKVGIVSPIANSSVVFTILFSLIFFGEVLSLFQIFSVLLILLGIILVSINLKDFRNSHLFDFSSGIPYALLTTFLWGLVFFLFKIPVDVLGPILTSFIIEFGVLVYSGIHLFFSSEGFSIKDKSVLKHLFFVALFGAIGTLFFNLGISRGAVSIVAALTFANPLIATLYGKFVYKEELYLQQYLAIIVIVLGVVMISV